MGTTGRLVNLPPHNHLSSIFNIPSISDIPALHLVITITAGGHTGEKALVVNVFGDGGGDDVK